MDRFENIFIFQKLKELNKVINNYLESNPPNWFEKRFKIKNRTKLTRKIIFAYLTKNQIFEDQNKQTKFFDLIIPIVPTISQSKASEVWSHEFNKIISGINNTLTIDYINTNIKDYFAIISEWVYDFREIYNILNQYKIYYNIFNSNKPNLKTYDDPNLKLLSFIIFKNIFYKVSVSIWKKISNQMTSKTWAHSVDIHNFIWQGFVEMQSLNKFIIFKRKQDLISVLKNPKELLTLNSEKVDIYYLLNYMLNFLRKKNLSSYFYSSKFHYKYENYKINTFEKKFLKHIFTEKKISLGSFEAYNIWWNENQTDNKINLNNIEHNNEQKESDELEYTKFIKQLNDKGFPFSELDIFYYSSLHKNDHKLTDKINTINSNKIDKNKSSLKDMFNILKIKFEKINKKDKLLKEIYMSHFYLVTHWKDEMSSNIDLTNIFLKLVDYDYVHNLINHNFSIKEDSLSQWFINIIFESDKAVVLSSSLFHNIFWISTPIGQLLLLVILIKFNKDIEPKILIEKLELIKGNNIKKSYIDQLTTFTLKYYKRLSNDMLEALKALKDSSVL